VKLSSSTEDFISGIDEYDDKFDLLYSKIRAKIIPAIAEINTKFKGQKHD
jgi:hypothetical protein